MSNSPAPADGLFYTAMDSVGKFRMGWIANESHNDFDSLDAWLEALQNLKSDTPDFALFELKRLSWSDFVKIAQKVA